MTLKLPAEQLRNVKHPVVLNQGFVASNLDIDTGVFFPRPIPQIEAETPGNQTSNRLNADIVIAGNALKNVDFINITDNTLLDYGGVAVINRVMDAKTSNALLYQGYNVCDGGISGFF